MPKNPHADFTPTLAGYSGITPFRFWCQTALPLTYDDSLSYYELLNKVVNYLNHTIEDLTNVENNTSELAEAYEKLQKYVNDYFDDIDIEAELRNVLDKMAEDGTLDALLNPLVENQLPGVVDEKIDGVVAEQIDGAVAGQIDESVADQLPALVDAGIPGKVSDWLEENVDPVGSAVMVDSSLTISGAAADAKVTGDELSDLKTQLSNLETRTGIIDLGELTRHKYINTSGVETATTNDASYVTDYIDLSNSNSIWIKGFLESIVIENVISFYQSDYTYISGIVGSGDNTASHNNSGKNYEIEIPNNAKYIRLSLFVWNYDIEDNYIMWDFNKEYYTDVENEFMQYATATGLTKNISEYDVTAGYYESILDGYISGNANAYSTNLFEIPTGVVRISSTFSALNIECAIALYDASQNRIDYVAGIGNESHTYSISIPEQAKYFRVSGWKANINPPTTYNIYFEDVKNKISFYEAGKIKYIAFGDSITSGAGSTGNNNSYATRLNAYFNFNAFVNNGVSGSSVVKQDNANAILYQKTALLTNFDGIITVAIGTNDYGNSIGTPLGNAEQIIEEDFTNISAPSTTYDANYTFAEGFRYTLESLRKNNPNARIIVLLPINRNNENVANSLGYTLEDYREAERIIAKAQGMPVIDMQECGLPMKRESTYTADGLHPNDFGYKVMTAFLVPIIERYVDIQTYFNSIT